MGVITKRSVDRSVGYTSTLPEVHPSPISYINSASCSCHMVGSSLSFAGRVAVSSLEVL